MIKKFRYWLWVLGLGGDKCPYCGEKLMEHGFWPNDRWTCQEGSTMRSCEFNKNGEEVRL